MSRIVVVGASRGIGAEIAQYFQQQGHEVYSVSRTYSEYGQWIEADITDENGILTVVQILQQKTVDLLVYSSGIWETLGFTEDFDFCQTTAAETFNIMQVNLVAPIEITKHLAPNLATANNPRAIYLGALSGVENRASDQVAYNASKFGLRGAIQSLRIALKDQGIGFTTFNLGNVATPEVLEDIAQGRMAPQEAIPIADIIASIEYICELSPTVEIADIDLMQK
ncbi:SDR family NAD(P)-dependent oxidoreductase [Catenovulum sp. SM1970]|uniref:SDR family NAD(P)-dependent oxidoreductase n=1 Tax=Marinifaba aquimaris TaxID=2741323 RepID=UPI00157221E5|nr:SDR family NAD(P)-dependent oxidoreductase [Marinifaba aquimaris]NTS76783.1 SDR family NAD(P)-dependent oxidoreductase [Marinifaba aquimaris]